MSLDSIINRKPPTLWDQFIASPLLFLNRQVYHSFPRPLHDPTVGELQGVRFVCISDTHNVHEELPLLPHGDVLVHAGDLTERGTVEELYSVLTWLNNQSHLHKIFIAGNHDKCLSNTEVVASITQKYPGLTYLQESSVSIAINNRNLVVYGSAFTPGPGNFAFQYPRMYPSPCLSKNRWSNIPSNVDVLVTHGPPRGHLDFQSGCFGLMQALWALQLKPKVHIFGHIHGAHGIEVVGWTHDQQCYERIADGIDGWCQFPCLLLGWVLRICHRLVGIPYRRNPATTLVNAASTAGLRDEKRLEAVVIDI